MIASETKTIQSRATALGLTAVVGTMLLSTLNASHAQTLVRDLDNPARQPFQAELQRLRIPSSGGGESFRVADVPPGKRLVIEHVSFRVASLEASTPGSPPLRFGTFASLITKANGVPGSHELIANRIDLSGGRSVVAASQQIRAYADPGSQVFVRISGRTEDDGDSLQVTHLTVSGHLVEAP